MSQHKAYDEPFTKKTGVKILNVDKSADGLAGIRSQVEANNVTWNIVDLLQADAQRACDEGLIMRIDPDKWLAPAPDGTPATKDFVEGTPRRLLRSADPLFDAVRLQQDGLPRRRAADHPGRLGPEEVPGHPGAAEDPPEEPRMGADRRWRAGRQGL